MLRNVFNLSTGVQEPSTRSSSTDVIEAVENPYSSLPFISTRQGMYLEKPVVLHPEYWNCIAVSYNQSFLETKDD